MVACQIAEGSKHCAFSFGRTGDSRLPGISGVGSPATVADRARLVGMHDVKLRQWQDADLQPYAAMNADPEVMRHFPALLTADESAASMRRIITAIDERGWGLWAVEVDGQFAGFTGLEIPRFQAHFTPCVEIGWRFRKEFWGRGLAYRAALQALDYAFSILHLPEVVSFTATCNDRSRRLMERLQFIYDPSEDFDHPSITEGHHLRRHVLYRKKAEPRTAPSGSAAPSDPRVMEGCQQ